MTGIEELQEINFCKVVSLADFHYISKNQVSEKRKSSPNQFFLKDYLIIALQNPQKNLNNTSIAWQKNIYKILFGFMNKKSSYWNF